MRPRAVLWVQQYVFLGGSVVMKGSWTIICMEDIQTGDELALAFAQSTGRAREKAGRELLKRYDKAIEGIIRDDAARAGVHVASIDERADLRADLRICLFDAAVRFDPAKVHESDGGGFDHWVRYLIQNKIAESAGEKHVIEMPESWQRVARIASKVEEDLTQKLRRTPNREELSAGVLAHCRQWSEAKLRESGEATAGDALAKAVDDKLRKQGTLGAIERLNEIMMLRGKMAAIDTEYEPMGRESEPSAFEGIMSMLSEVERDVIERRMGLVDGREWTFEEIGEDLGKPWPEIRRIMGRALTKPKAPHAQYVYISGIEAQIDTGRGSTAIERVRARSAN